MDAIETGYQSREAFYEFHQRLQRFAVLVCHRRAGKTVSTINDLIDAALRCEKPSPRFAYIAPLYSQAKNIAWDYLKSYTQAIPGRTVNEAELRVDLPNGGRIRLFGADNPDSLRGIYLDGVAIDEPAQMKKAMWEEVIRPAISDRHGFAIFIGTPKGRNWFYDLYREAQKDPEWFTMRLRASESGLLHPDEIRGMTKSMPDAVIAQELECSFEAPDVVQFLTHDIINEARARELVRNTGARVMGVDVARFGDDRTVLLVRADALEHVQVLRNLDTMQVAALTAEMAERWKPQVIFVDGNGVGGGVVDRLRALSHRVIDVQAGGKATASTRYLNKRAEMWGEMREWLRDRGILPPNTPHLDELIDDLVSPQYSFDNANRMVLEKKDEMKRRGVPSPDIGDALALTFAEPIASPELRAAMQIWQEPEREYCPLDDY